MVRILNGIWNLESQPFEIRTNGCHFVRNHLKSRQKVWILNYSVFECLRLQPQLKPNHLKTKPFEIWPWKSLDFKCFHISDPQCNIVVWYSGHDRSKLSGVQVVTYWTCSHQKSWIPDTSYGSLMSSSQFFYLSIESCYAVQTAGFHLSDPHCTLNLQCTVFLCPPKSFGDQVRSSSNMQSFFIFPQTSTVVHIKTFYVLCHNTKKVLRSCIETFYIKSWLYKHRLKLSEYSGGSNSKQVWYLDGP